MFIYRGKLEKIDMGKDVKSLLRNVFCSLPMGLAAYLICSIGNWSTSGHLGEKVSLLSVGILVGLGIYLACSYWTKNEEMLFLLKMIRRKRR